MTSTRTNHRVSTGVNGVIIGVLVGFDQHGKALVAFPDSPSEVAVAAHTIATLDDQDLGREVALLFEDGDRSRPLIIGRLLKPGSSKPPEYEVLRGKESITISADREITLKCGKASITLTRAGKILINGTYVSSKSSGAHKIKGGSVQVN